MNSVTRELIAGTGAIAALAGSLAASLPLWVSVVVSVLVYAGLRLTLPVRPVQPAQDSHRQFLAECHTAVESIRAKAQQLPRGKFRSEVNQLVDVLERLVRRAEKKDVSRPGQVDPEFPERMKQLTALLERYSDVSQQKRLSDSAQAALDHTEEVFTKTRDTFDVLLQRAVDAEAVDLKVDARVYEELMDIEYRWNGIGPEK